MTFDFFCKGRKDFSSPDPGQYNIPSTFGQGPKFSIHQKRRDPKYQSSPGYNLLPSTLSRRSSTIGSRLKSNDNKNIDDPGFLMVPSTIGEGPKVAIHNRHQEYIYKTPGPGQYEPKLLSDGPSFSFGSGSRNSFIQDNTLVPPGTYDIPSTLDSRPRTISSRPTYQSNKKPPDGPKYKISQPIGQDSPKFSFSRAPLNSPIPKTPGPGDYEIPNSLISNTTPIHMHSRPHLKEPETNSAPYHVAPSSIIPTKINMGSRPPTSYETISPGPIYNQGTTIVPRPMTIRPKTELNFIKSDVPSPDTYWIAPVTPIPPPICGFRGPGSRDLIDENEQKHLPGPGEYNKPRIFEDGKIHGYTIQHKTNTKIRPDSAAPYHSATSTLGGPSYTIGLRDV